MRKLSRRQFAGATGALLQAGIATGQTTGASEMREVYPGVWRLRFARPEPITPVSTRKYAPAEGAATRLAEATTPPYPLESIVSYQSRRGTVVKFPLAPNERIYGLGLQLQSFEQRGRKKTLRVNADPKMDSGDSHAPVPFWVTTRGYGVLIDSARYITVYCGNKHKRGRGALPPGTTPPDGPSEFIAEVPVAEGVDVYVFAGPSMRDAVSRYNLYSGGGPLPPRWGLGFWYRCFGQFNQEQVLSMGSALRDSRIPCDVLGLEPGWQTHAYSCSFVWSDKFPDPRGMLHKLASDHYRVNLWEHAFTYPTSPIYKPLYPLSGDYEVWNGIVPDFLQPEARRIFSDFHEKEHVALGVDGYKLDECDNSDFTGSWSFPELSSFPSGADGEQMHCLFGLRYQDTIQSIFDRRNQRTLGLVRSSQALAAPYPYVLYSDLYDHREFIRGVANAGFSGLLWCPEVRDAKNAEDLIRRLQTVVFSPLAMVNAWYIQNPPWKQVDRESNNRGNFAAGWQQLEAQCREIILWRMRLLPYLYAAYVNYHQTGLPPFRALVLDYPEDAGTWKVDDQYLMGDALLVAPVVAGETQRGVYLPPGDWYDFWTGEKHGGSTTLKVSPPLDRIPVYVKSGTLLPLAEDGLHADDPAHARLHVRSYGPTTGTAILFEDDGGMNPNFTRVELRWQSVRRTGPGARPTYRVVGWEQSGI